jgi:hypothetical protein
MIYEAPAEANGFQSILQSVPTKILYHELYKGYEGYTAVIKKQFVKIVIHQKQRALLTATSRNQ